MPAVAEAREQALSITETTARTLELIEWKIRFYEERLGRT